MGEVRKIPEKRSRPPLNTEFKKQTREIRQLRREGEKLDKQCNILANVMFYLILGILIKFIIQNIQ